MRDLKKAVEIQKIANEENLSLEVLELDVDDEKSAENAINTIIQEKGRIDVLVNNAGWGLWGTAEDVSLDEFRAQFQHVEFLNMFHFKIKNLMPSYQDIRCVMQLVLKQQFQKCTEF